MAIFYGYTLKINECMTLIGIMGLEIKTLEGSDLSWPWLHASCNLTDHYIIPSA